MKMPDMWASKANNACMHAYIHSFDKICVEALLHGLHIIGPLLLILTL